MANAVFPVPGLPAINTPLPVILPFLAMLTIIEAALRATCWPIIPWALALDGSSVLSSRPSP